MEELTRALAEQAGCSQERMRELLRLFLDGIVDTLLLRGEIRIGHFGTFEVRMRKGRAGRNPRTGEKLKIPPRAVVVFRPGLEMRERIGQLQELPQQGGSA